MFFDVTGAGDLGETGCNNANFLYTLTGPTGEVFDEFLFSCNSDVGPVELPAGTYTLTIDGRSNSTGNYQITTLNVPAPDTDNFSIGDVISGEIETPGVTDIWTFTTPGQTVFFDVTGAGDLGETGCNNANFLYTLTGADGQVFNEFLFSCNSDVGPVELPAGTYTLTIDGRSNSTGNYQITTS